MRPFPLFAYACIACTIIALQPPWSQRTQALFAFALWLSFLASIWIWSPIRHLRLHW
jgi:uncharacterized protein (DUF58 family)